MTENIKHKFFKKEKKFFKFYWKMKKDDIERRNAKNEGLWKVKSIILYSGRKKRKVKANFEKNATKEFNTLLL